MQAEITWDRLDKTKFFFWGAALSSGVGGCLYPLSVIKTRQMAIDSQDAGFKGLQRTIVNIYSQNGLLGFYKGFGTVLIGTIPARAVYLTSMELTKSKSAAYLKQFNLSDSLVMGISGFMGGASASLAGQAVTVPVDVVSQRRMLQDNQKGPIKNLKQTLNVFENNPNNKNLGVFSMIHHIVKTEGIKGLFRGFAISLFSSVPAGSIWWGSYSFYKATITLQANKWLLPARLPHIRQQNQSFLDELESQDNIKSQDGPKQNFVSQQGYSSRAPYVQSNVEKQGQSQHSNNSINSIHNHNDSNNLSNNSVGDSYEQDNIFKVEHIQTCQQDNSTQSRRMQKQGLQGAQSSHQQQCKGLEVQDQGPPGHARTQFQNHMTKAQDSTIQPQIQPLTQTQTQILTQPQFQSQDIFSAGHRGQPQHSQYLNIVEVSNKAELSNIDRDGNNENHSDKNSNNNTNRDNPPYASGLSKSGYKSNEEYLNKQKIKDNIQNLRENHLDQLICLSQRELFGIQVMSSLVAGMTSSVFLNPLDIVKTRIQVSNQVNPGSNPTIMNVVQTIYKNDGPTGFWRGIIPKLFSSMLWGTAMVTTYEVLKVIAVNDDSQ